MADRGQVVDHGQMVDMVGGRVGTPAVRRPELHASVHHLPDDHQFYVLDMPKWYIYGFRRPGKG